MNILIANCGTLAAGPGLISMLRDTGYCNKIVGIDLNPHNPAKHLVDVFYEAPPAKSSDFVSFVMNICKKEDVGLILSTSTDLVLLPLKKNEKLFNEIGVKIPGTDYDSLLKVNDKGEMLRLLSLSNIPCAKFRLPSSVEELKSFSRELGYPEKKVVVKPRVSSGNRGFRILDAKAHLQHRSVLSKPGTGTANIELKEYVNSISNENKFPSLVLMEYLPHTDYSVYCLADKGKPLATIPMIRIKPENGVTHISKVSMDKDAISMANRVVKYFNLDWNVNIQMKISDSGQPLVYEINPRLAGSIILTKAAGCNLLDLGIKKSLGQKLGVKNPIDGTIMYRYFTEVFSEEP